MGLGDGQGCGGGFGFPSAFPEIVKSTTCYYLSSYTAPPTSQKKKKRNNIKCKQHEMQCQGSKVVAGRQDGEPSCLKTHGPNRPWPHLKPALLLPLQILWNTFLWKQIGNLSQNIGLYEF